MSLLEGIDSFSKTIGYITDRQAYEVIDLINGKLVEELQPQIIDLMQVDDGQEGPILQPVKSVDNTWRRGAKPFQLRKDSGLWAWIYETKKPVWVEGLSAGPGGPVMNRATGDALDPRYLHFFRKTSSLMAVPLITDNELWGIYSIELGVSGKFRRDHLSLLRKLSAPLARILVHADAFRRKVRHIDETIHTLGRMNFFSRGAALSQYRTGFVARPFRAQFNLVEDCISSFLLGRGIRAQRFKYPAGSHRVVINEIMSAIRGAHFCIIDVTGCNPNVLFELGVVLGMNKRHVLLRRRSDRTELPFDLRPFNFYHYRVEDGSALAVYDPGTERFEPIEKMLAAFVKGLEDDPIFCAARPWRES